MQTLRDEQLAVLQQVQPELEHADVAMDQSDSYFGGNEGAGAPDMDTCTLAPNMNTLLIDDEWVEERHSQESKPQIAAAADALPFGDLHKCSVTYHCLIALQQHTHTVLRNCTLIWRSSTSGWGSSSIPGMDISQHSPEPILSNFKKGH